MSAALLSNCAYRPSKRCGVTVADDRKWDVQLPGAQRDTILIST